MLNFEEIKKEYTGDLHKFSRGLVREYLQYEILAIVFSHPLSQKLSFLGETALRIVYNLKRFSEDIDFDNKGLDFTEFKEIGNHVEKELEKKGYEVEIKTISKGAFHCYIKFPKLLYEQRLSPLAEERILIQLDTFDQGVDYESRTHILDKFDFFKQIIVTPKEVILAQKMWTITQRPRLKGRDFFDVMYLLQTTRPDKKFLQAKFATTDTDEVKRIVLEHIASADLNILAKDVEPFLMRAEDSQKITLFRDFFEQVSF